MHFSVVEVNTKGEEEGKGGDESGRPFLKHSIFAYLLDPDRPELVHEMKLYKEDLIVSPSSSSSFEKDTNKNKNNNNNLAEFVCEDGSCQAVGGSMA